MDTKKAQIDRRDAQFLESFDANTIEDQQNLPERCKRLQKFGRMFHFTARFLLRGTGSPQIGGW